MGFQKGRREGRTCTHDCIRTRQPDSQHWGPYQFHPHDKRSSSSSGSGGVDSVPPFPVPLPPISGASIQYTLTLCNLTQIYSDDVYGTIFQCPLTQMYSNVVKFTSVYSNSVYFSSVYPNAVYSEAMYSTAVYFNSVFSLAVKSGTREITRGSQWG